ncbi:NAD-dependent epimerase/dehydratase family protein [Micromonospora sp. NPDC002389]|uniref:NAD-dependent epimerase/dehydratase family protein n=1 Tax=Micromonospora sp. NPDC002389 TaxID=3154272 RepID=UPI00332B932A
MRLLVVGGSGFLGREVCRRAVATGWDVVGTHYSGRVEVPGVASHRVDVTDRAAVRELVTRVRPDAVVGTPYRYADWAVTADGAAHVACAAVEVAGADAVSRAELGLLVARRDRLDPSALRITTGPAVGVRRSTEVRLDSARAAVLLRTRLRGVAELLAA